MFIFSKSNQRRPVAGGNHNRNVQNPTPSVRTALWTHEADRR